MQHPSTPRLRSRFAAVAAGVAVAATTGLIYAAGAGATVNPVVIDNGNAAGAYTAPNANRIANGDKIDGVKAEMYLLPSAAFNTTDSALWNTANDGSKARGDALMGVELCHATSLVTATEAAVVFAQWNSSQNAFDIFAGHTTSTDCLGALGGVTGVHQIDSVPKGHQVFVAITQIHNFDVTFTDEDLSADTGGVAHFGGFSFFGFNRAGIGTNTGLVNLNAPPSLKLVRFTNDQVRDTHSGWGNIGSSTLTRYRTRLVQQADGSGDVFVSPHLTGAALKLTRGTTNSTP